MQSFDCFCSSSFWAKSQEGLFFTAEGTICGQHPRKGERGCVVLIKSTMCGFVFVQKRALLYC